MNKLSAILAIALMAVGLSACGGQTETPKPTTAPTSTSEAKPTEDAKDEEPAKDEAVGSLTIWMDDRADKLAGFADTFTEETGVKVEIVKKSESDLDKDFIAQVPTGEGPDLVVLAHDRLGGLVKNGVVGTYDMADASKHFAKAALAGVAYDGQTYGVPYGIEGVALVRNNKLTKAEPATFDAMIDEGKKAGAKYPFIIQVGEEGGDPYHMYGFQTSFGAPVFKQADDGSYVPEVAMGGEGGTKFAQWLADQGKAKVLDPAITGDIAKQAFIDGEAAFTVTGPWNIGAFKDAGMDISVLPVPSAGGSPATPFVGVQAFFPSAKSENTVLVNKFLEWVSSEAAQKVLLEKDARLPVQSDVAKGMEDPILKGWAEAIANGVPMPAIPEMGAVWDFWGTTEVDIMNAKQEPKAAWDKMVENVTNAITKK